MKAKDLVIGEEYQETSYSDGSFSRKVKLVRIAKMSKRHGWSSADSDIGGYYEYHAGRPTAVISYMTRAIWGGKEMTERLDAVPLANIRKTWAEYEIELQEKEQRKAEALAKRKVDMDMNLHANRPAFGELRRRACDAGLHVGALGGQLRVSRYENYNELDIDAALSSQPATGVQVIISLADLYDILSERES